LYSRRSQKENPKKKYKPKDFFMKHILLSTCIAFFCQTGFSYDSSDFRRQNSQEEVVDYVEKQLDDSGYPISDFRSYKEQVEVEIAKSIPLLGEKTVLRDACEYALTNGGKRVRPLIVLMVAEALGKGANAYDAALSVEFFHTASLIADDLPCMDNDDLRRGKPSLHKVYGETIALLASYALIVAGFERIHLSATKACDAGFFSPEESDRLCRIALENATRTAGLSGATGGQFLDLYPPALTLESIREIIRKKTGTLFEAAFGAGWIFGGGDLDLMEDVKEMAQHLGMAFQVADDLGDIFQDEENECVINVAHFVGKEKAFAIFEEEMSLFEEGLKNLGINTPLFQKLSDKLREHAVQNML
jgi:geranylgeranyl diphosphate synthase, type II